MANQLPELILTDYLERLRKLLRRAPAGIREDALREVRSHIEDEWHALGGGAEALATVLDRMGPPETYGRDLALQLILLKNGPRPSPLRLVLAAFFWASTSLIGSIVVVCATLVLGFGLGMLATAILRLTGHPQAVLFHAVDYRMLGMHFTDVRFPAADWSPALIALVGLLPSALILAGMYRFYMLWVRSRLAERGLEIVVNRRPVKLSQGWERQAAVAMLAFAALGFSSCVAFSLIGELVKVGEASQVSLPQDFFRTPLTALAFLGGLVFLCAPVLGLLWAARRAQK